MLYFSMQHIPVEGVCRGWQPMFDITVTCQLPYPDSCNSTLLKLPVNMIMSDSNDLFPSDIQWSEH